MLVSELNLCGLKVSPSLCNKKKFLHQQYFANQDNQGEETVSHIALLGEPMMRWQLFRPVVLMTKYIHTPTDQDHFPATMQRFIESSPVPTRAGQIRSQPQWADLTPRPHVSNGPVSVKPHDSSYTRSAVTRHYPAPPSRSGYQCHSHAATLFPDGISYSSAYSYCQSSCCGQTAFPEFSNMAAPSEQGTVLYSCKH